MLIKVSWQPGGLLRGDLFLHAFWKNFGFWASMPRSVVPKSSSHCWIGDCCAICECLQKGGQGDGGSSCLDATGCSRQRRNIVVQGSRRILIAMPRDRIYIAPMQTLLDRLICFRAHQSLPDVNTRLNLLNLPNLLWSTTIQSTTLPSNLRED
jgi:hypothetical protein